LLHGEENARRRVVAESAAERVLRDDGKRLRVATKRRLRLREDALKRLEGAGGNGRQEVTADGPAFRFRAGSGDRRYRRNRLRRRRFRRRRGRRGADDGKKDDGDEKVSRPAL